MQYEVTVICKVKKVVTCEDCTEQEARDQPFDFSIDELEIDQLDFEVVDVREARK